MVDVVTFNPSPENPSSIEVGRNAKGEYAFKVKIYFEGYNPDTLNDALGVTNDIQQIYNDLIIKFKK